MAIPSKSFITVLLSISAMCLGATPDSPQTGDLSRSDQVTQAADGSPRASEGPLSRWLDLDAASLSLRYRNSFDTNGTHIFDDVQQRSLLAGKLKLDRQGKYFVGFRASSGRYFNWSYANISGTDYQDAVSKSFASMAPARQYVAISAFYGDPNGSVILSHEVARGWQFYLRDLYLSATPVKGVTLEFGSIPIERGVGTEITTYDEDGYIAGERIRVKDSHHLYLDQIAFTSAYLGDIYFPNFFDRYDRLTQSNYRQIIGEKQFGPRLKASADYTWLAGTHTVREAVLVKTKESRVLDTARLELYQRVNDRLFPAFLAPAGNGWAFTGTRKLAKQVTVEGGYATIDQDNGVYGDSGTLAAFGFALNADSFQVGQRFFGRATVKVVPGVSLFGFYTHQINSKSDPFTFSYNRQNINFGMQLDFKAMMQKAHLL